MTDEYDIDTARLADIIDMLARVAKTRTTHVIAGAARMAVADFAASMARPSARRMLALLDLSTAIRFSTSARRRIRFASSGLPAMLGGTSGCR